MENENLIKELCFYFRVAKEAELAGDEDGNPDECYCNHRLTFKNPMTEDEALAVMAEQTENVRAFLAAVLQTKKEYLTPVSEEEFIRNTEEQE